MHLRETEARRLLETGQHSQISFSMFIIQVPDKIFVKSWGKS